ncbi:DUF3526 domain-containing protein [Cellulophaga omnivescoria]|uniref:DUF3526 domain-containing protein n=1 Tax=Cellulophaga omnivescoria TaxID=1888890 RepID=UPI0022F0CAC4|nr:DUF3526 domain-containing protein [Cellulophaga omnivescoria]WBU90842.1 DUF3526 domain-containing protein [Cellulophaga omnivescoria]
MIRYIVKKEIKEIFRDGRFKISALIVFVLAVVAFFVTFKQYKNTAAQYNEAKANERKVWESQGAKNPHSAAHYGNYVFKPKSPLSLIDQGVDKYTGISVFLEAHNRNEAAFSDAADQTALSRFGALTPDFILLYIIPLIIILIGYNIFSKEIEGSTFFILKSQGVVGWKLFIGKWLAALLPTLVIATVLFVVAAVTLTSLNDFGLFEWKEILALYCVYVLYYLIFTNVVLFISSKVKKSGIALVINLVFWVLACFVAPKVASNLADAKYPYPSHQEFNEQIANESKQGLDGHKPWNEESQKLREQTLKEYKVDSVHKLPFNFNAFLMQKSEEYQAQVYAKHYGLLKEKAKKQGGVYKSLSAISPFLPTRFLSMAIANTDYESHWAFTEAAEEYRVGVQRFLNGTTEKNAKYNERYVAPADTWSKLEEFNYESPTFSEVYKQNSSVFSVLIIWFVLTAALLFFTNKKY